MRFGGCPVDRFSQQFHSECFLTTKDGFDGVVPDTAVIVGVAKPSAELFIGRDLLKFVF